MFAKEDTFSELKTIAVIHIVFFIVSVFNFNKPIIRKNKRDNKIEIKNFITHDVI